MRRVNRGAPPGRQRRKHVVQIGAREPLGGNERFVVVQVDQRDQADAGRGVYIGIERLFNIALHLRLRDGVPSGQDLVQLIGDGAAVIGNIDGQFIGRVQHIAQLVRAHFQRQKEAVIDALVDDLRHIGAGDRKKEQHDEQRHQREYGDQPVPNRGQRMPQEGDEMKPRTAIRPSGLLRSMKRAHIAASHLTMRTVRRWGARMIVFPSF